MALSFSQRFLIKTSKYLKDAFSEPGVLYVFEEELFDFGTPKVVDKFIALTDEEHGGQSTAALRHSTEEGEPAGCMVFEGRFSSAIPPNAPAEVHRLGQAACQSKGRHLQTQFGHYFWLGEYERQVASTIKYRLRGDGRLYSLFMKSDSYVEGVGVDEIWQAFVETKAGEWQDISVPVVDFLLTTGGYLTRDRRYINLRRVTSMGVAVAGGREVQEDGPYQLCISRIAAGYDTDRSSGNED